MSYFQNVFDSEFRQSLPMGDRQYVLNFIVPANKNHPGGSISWNGGNYDLSVDNTLTFYVAYDADFKIWTPYSVNIAGTIPAATKAEEIVSILNANANFNERLVAYTKKLITTPVGDTVLIQAKQTKGTTKFYFDNAGAEKKLKFNKFAGVADVPTYMNRHTIANRFNYPDSQGNLIKLSQVITGNTAANPTVVTSVAHGLTNGDTIYVVNSNSTPTLNGARVVTATGTDTFTVPVNVSVAGTRGEFLNPVNYNVVTDYGIDYTTAQADWQLLRGRASGLFNMQNITVDGSNRITQIIEYPTGSQPGDFARKINYTYTGANTNPSQITEIPITLAASDLITPP